MTPSQLVAQQLAKRLVRVKRQIATLTAEAEMIERMLIDAERPGVVPTLKLRKNSTGKWTARGQIRRFLEANAEPVKAQAILDHLRKFDPSLNASTFRSHLKRMVDDGTVRSDGPRGHYQLVKRPDDESSEERVSRPRRIISSRQV